MNLNAIGFLIAALPALAAAQPYQPLRVAGNMKLDGKLDEQSWQSALAVDDFMQADPAAGAESSEKTEARIVYNDEFLFVGVRAFDREPSQIVRSALERDFNIDQDDNIAFIIDTYNDKGTGLVFSTNTLGARWDTEIFADGGSDNPSFNTFWDAAGHVDSLGYTVEFRIPFSSLRFESKPKVIMGFRLVRVIKRKNEYLVYPRADPSISDIYFKVSLAKEMEFHDLRSKKPFYITPFVTANYSEAKHLNAQGNEYVSTSEFISRKDYVENETADKILSNIGVDAKYGLSKNFTLDFTLNTDFAQAEVDNRIINLSKYEVNLPEKRSFFLESRNYLGFSTTSGNEYFISRRIGRENDKIVPIISGVRITGKSKGWQMGFLDMQTKGDLESDIAPHNFFAFRTRKDIDSIGSFAGGIVTSRFNTGRNNDSHQTIALDLVKKFNQYLVLVGAYGITTENGKFNDVHESSNYNFGLFRNAREGFSFSLSADWLGNRFNPVMGFVEETDLLNTGASGQYVWKAREKSRLAYTHILINISDRYKPELEKEESRYGYLQTGLSFKSGAQITVKPLSYKRDLLFFDWQISEHIMIPRGSYTMYSPSVYFNSPQKGNVKADLLIEFLDFYDGDRISVSPSISCVISKHIIAQAAYQWNHIEFPKEFSDNGNALYESHLIGVNLSVFFSSRLSVKLLSQYDNLSNSLGSNLRLRYNPREGTDLYIVYNSGMNTDLKRLDPHLPLIGNQGIVVKFLKTFAL